MPRTGNLVRNRRTSAPVLCEADHHRRAFRESSRGGRERQPLRWLRPDGTVQQTKHRSLSAREAPTRKGWGGGAGTLTHLALTSRDASMSHCQVALLPVLRRATAAGRVEGGRFGPSRVS